MPKNRSKSLCLAIALAISAFPAFSAGGGDLIGGDSWACLVEAPEGWVMDEASLRLHGIQGLFVKAGASFDPTLLHMYIFPSPKAPGGSVSLGDFIKTDEASYVATRQGIHARTLPDYDPGMGYRYAMRELDDSVEGYYEAIAYYEGEAAFFAFILSCRSPEERSRERGALLALLDSFTYLRKE
jgi:hypothetical protein